MFRRLLDAHEGGVAVMAAAGGALACLVAGLVIDFASMALYARRLQGAADLGALAAARDLPRAQAAGEATVHSNMEGVGVAVVTGVYRARAELSPNQRFTPLGPGGAANAAQVRVSGEAPLWFASLLGRSSAPMTRVGRAAIPARAPLAMLSIGSRLARLDGGIANQVLSGLTGSSVSLSVMDYQALAEADVQLLGFTEALATTANVRVGDYDSLLTKTVDAGHAVQILSALSDGADPAIDRLARAATGRTLRVGDVLSVDAAAPDGLQGALDAHVSALDLAHAIIETAAGDRQVKLDLSLPTGVADLDVWLAIGERPNRSPWLAVAGDGSITVRTAQARLYLNLRTARGLAIVGRVALPLIIELASAEARLASIDCQPARKVKVDARSGVARLRIAQTDPARLNDFKHAIDTRPAVLIDVAGLVKVVGEADVELASPAFQRLTYDEASISDRRAQTVRATAFTSGAVVSLLQRLRLDVRVAGLGLGLGGLASEIGAVLAPIGPLLDGLIDTALQTLGLKLGEADVTVLEATCPTRPSVPVLVG